MTFIPSRERRHRPGAFALTVLVAILLTAPAPLIARAQDRTPTADLGGLTGQIEVDGSSTVGPITEAAAEEFANAGAKDVEISVGISGTGGGFERFCNGETDISDASREIKQEEADKCAESNVDYYRFDVGSDGITVVVNKNNEFLTCISTDSLKQIWSEDRTTKTFADLNPEFPGEEIALYGPGPDSGTFDFFNEEILGEAAEPTTDYTPSEDDNVLVEGVAGDENALGYFGFAYYDENKDSLNAVALATNGDLSDCVTPSPDTIRDGSYPLSRPLFIYVKAESLQDEAVQEFVRFYINNAEQVVTEADFVPQPKEVYDADKTKIEWAISGQIEPDGPAAARTPEA